MKLKPNKTDKFNIDSSYGGNQKKGRKMAGLLLVFMIVLYFMNKSPEEIVYVFTTFYLPSFTYESEFGDSKRYYSSSYDVPEWFYEDEGDITDNADLAVMDVESVEDNVSGSEKDEAAEEMTPAVSLIKNDTIGTTFTREQLQNPDFLTGKIFVVDSNTSMNMDELNAANLLDKDMTLDDVHGEGGGYKVLIYHTHASESFADSRPGVKEDTVVGVGGYLAKLLNEQYNIPTYHDETTYDVIDGVLDRSKAYENSYNGISRILADNPSIEVVIDLHRDGVDEETHLVTDIGGKRTAKIMFLNGVSRSNMNGDIDYLENPNKLSNLAFSFQLYLAGKEEYGDFVRKIYVRSLRYNLHVMPRATLIEAGAQNNTLEEEMNAMEPLAFMLDKVLRNSR